MEKQVQGLERRGEHKTSPPNKVSLGFFFFFFFPEMLLAN